MSHLFQRPLCDMGRAFEYSFQPVVGELDPTSGGGCDDRPHRVELFAAEADPGLAPDRWRPFALCSEHEEQLRRYDARLTRSGQASRFRTPGLPPR